MKTKLNDIMKQSRARMCQALLLYGCFFTAPLMFFCLLMIPSADCGSQSVPDYKYVPS